MHLEAGTFSIEFAKDYEYRFQFLQVIEDEKGLGGARVCPIYM